MRIREHPTRVISGNTTYIVYVCGDEREDGTWEGWIEFHPTDAGHPTLSTERETSQPNAKPWSTGPMVLNRFTSMVRWSVPEGECCRSCGHILWQGNCC